MSVQGEESDHFEEDEVSISSEETYANDENAVFSLGRKSCDRRLRCREQHRQNRQKLKRRIERMRRNSKLVKLNKMTMGQDWQRSMKKPTLFLNKEVRPSFNIMFSSLEANWKRLLLGIVIAFLIIALVLSGFFWGASCSRDYHYGRVYIYTLGQLVTGPGFVEMTDIDAADLPASCLFIGFLASTCTLALNAFVLSLAVRKFMKPKGAFQFTKKMAFNTRDGHPCLQFRVANLRGNLVTKVEARASFGQFVKSKEGEGYFRMTEMDFKAGFIMKGPLTFSHAIDENSPLYRDYRSQNVISGIIMIQLTGYDHVLHDDVNQIWAYELPRDAAPCSRFADVVAKGVSDSVKDGSYTMEINMSGFNAVVPCHDQSRCCMLCANGCPLGSQVRHKRINTQSMKKHQNDADDAVDHVNDTQEDSIPSNDNSDELESSGESKGILDVDHDKDAGDSSSQPVETIFVNKDNSKPSSVQNGSSVHLTQHTPKKVPPQQDSDQTTA